MAETEGAAKAAAEKIAEEFQMQKDAEADAQLRAQVLSLAAPPARLNEAGANLAKSAMAAAVALLPPGTEYGQLAKVRDAALKPFRELVDRVQEQEAKTQQEQTERAQQERQVKSQREDQEREQQAKIQQELIEQARRESEVQSQRRAKEREQFQARLRLSSLRSWIFDELHALEEQGQLDELGFNERWRLAGKLEEKLKPILIDRLLAHPDLSDDRIKKRVGRLAQDHLDSVLAA
jgi:flagellar biosynthesis GTPase FlhF